MADAHGAKRGAKQASRPLSPHLQIYRPQWTWVPSIMHRMTGVGLALGAVLVVWWFLAAATDAEYFGMVDGLLTSWLGTLILIGSAWALSYHLLNGLRHLWWDTGHGFGMETVETSAKAVVGGSFVLALLLVLLA